MRYNIHSRKAAIWVVVIVVVALTQPLKSPAESTCDQGMDPFLVVLEREVAPGEPFRLLAVSEQPMGEVHLANGQSVATEVHLQHSGGPPYTRQFLGEAPTLPGEHPVRLVTVRGTQLACTRVTVRLLSESQPRPAPISGVWQIRRSWNDAWERLFSAWIAHLFRPLPDQPKGWRPLHKVLHKEERNFLYNNLDHGEDDPKSTVHVRARADCGDTPYQLRAYFAWKLGLPFRFRRCSRGSGARGPRCPFDNNNSTSAFDCVAHPVKRFNAFIEQGVAWQVHSGTMRTLPEDETSDLYPIALNRKSIRPGTVFVDVGSHALMVTQWDENGLFAIDGHPDRSVTRRRFSPRYFRYFLGMHTGGFKAFRPLRMRDGQIVSLPNNALKRFFSKEQYLFSTRRAFYSQMNRLMAENKGQSQKDRGM